MATKRIELNADVEGLLVLSDIHSFIEPLETIEGMIATWPRPVQVVVAGDILSGGANPVEVMEWVRTHAGEFAVLGNHDEAALRSGEDPAPVYTEAGGYQRLDQQQVEYINALPSVLELAWKGKLIRVTHGHRRLSGQDVAWTAKPSELLCWFADPAVDITTVAHTHYPFVAERDGSRVANCGSTAGLLLGMQHSDGSITSWGDEAVFEAPPSIYSTFLEITLEKDELHLTIKQFDYDRTKALSRLREQDDTHFKAMKRWLETGVVPG